MMIMCLVTSAMQDDTLPSDNTFKTNVMSRQPKMNECIFQ